MELAEFINRTRGTLGISDLSKRTIGRNPLSPNDPTLTRMQINDFLKKPRLSWLSAGTILDLSYALRVPAWNIVAANAAALGLTVESDIEARLGFPISWGDLTEAQQDIVRSTVEAFAEANTSPMRRLRRL